MQEGTAVDLRTGELWYLKLLNNVQAEIHKKWHVRHSGKEIPHL